MIGIRGVATIHGEFDAHVRHKRLQKFDERVEEYSPNPTKFPLAKLKITDPKSLIQPFFSIGPDLECDEVGFTSNAVTCNQSLLAVALGIEYGIMRIVSDLQRGRPLGKTL